MRPVWEFSEILGQKMVKLLSRMKQLWWKQNEDVEAAEMEYLQHSF